MANYNSDPLFRLIMSLTKAEKRNFKLYVARLKSGENAKFLKLFDLIEKQTVYNEAKILEKEKEFKHSQISNLKAHLYRQILQSLRTTVSNYDIDMKIREQIDYATILYNKCLYNQCIKMLEKAKAMAIKYDKIALTYEIVEFEKNLVIKHIKGSIEERVNELVNESELVREKLCNTNTFSNLAIKLYSFYLKIGFIRDQKDFDIANNFLFSTLPAFKEQELSFDEKMYLYSSLVGYHFFIHDFNRGYEYAKKWVELFDNHTVLIVPKIEMYIKAINNLLVAQSKLNRYNEFLETCKKFEAIRNFEDMTMTDNVELLLFKYSATHKLNKFFMLGQFTDGAKVIPEIEKGLEEFSEKLDEPYILIFYYKFACMYFGSDKYQEAVTWLNKIINAKDLALRSDIHSFARILNLICHYELNNNELVEHYIRSTYRFLIKKDDMHRYQQYIIRFLKKLNNISKSQLIDAFVQLKEQLLPLTHSPYEKRSFIYFDIISWLESKIENRKVQEIIREKAMKVVESYEDIID